MSLPIAITDPHFHVWDVATSPNPNLGGITSEFPTWTVSDYRKQAGELNVKGLVHVEAIVGQKQGGFVLDPVAETRAVASQASQLACGQKLVIVPFVHLGRDDAADVIAAHKKAAGDAFVGVRMILNYSESDPSLTWPQVERGDFLTGAVPTFDRNFPLLAAHGLSFDFHVNWFQLESAAAFLSRFSDTTVIVDHLGCPKLDSDGGAEEDARRIETWRVGMRALAALPHVHLKVSGLVYIKRHWIADASANAVVKSLVREAIDMFTPSRIVFASNFPVDLFVGRDDLVTLYRELHRLVEDLPLVDREAMFHGNAWRLYKCGSCGLTA